MRRRVALAFVMAAVGCSAPFACSSFSAAPSAGDASPPPEASGGGDDDGAAPSDAGAPLSFCATQPDASFCWSFDDTNDPLLGTSLTPLAGQTPVLTDAALSPPYAMTTELAGSGETSALSVKGSGAHVSCTAMVWVESADVGGTFNSVDVLLVTAGGGFGIAISLAADDASVAARTAYSVSGQSIANFPLRTWTAIAIDVDVDVDAGASSAVGRVNGKASAPEPGLQMDASAGPFEVDFGNTYPYGAFGVRFDDLACYWHD